MNSVSFITWAYKLIAQLAIALARLALARISTALLCYYLLFTIYYNYFIITSCFYYYYTNQLTIITGLLAISNCATLCTLVSVSGLWYASNQHTWHLAYQHTSIPGILLV